MRGRPVRSYPAPCKKSLQSRRHLQTDLDRLGGFRPISLCRAADELCRHTHCCSVTMGVQTSHASSAS
jgi:hypothetical protein